MNSLIRRKLNKSGFTLAETLMAILILLLVSSVIAAGIPAAVNAYTKAVDAASAQTLLSTTVNALRNELSTAWGVDPKDDNSVYYYKTGTGAKTKLYTGTEGSANTPTILVQDYVSYDNSAATQQRTGENRTLHKLVPDKKTTGDSDSKKLGITYGGVDFGEDEAGVKDKSLLVFTNVQVKKGDTVLAQIENLSIRLLNADFKVPDYVKKEIVGGGE